MIINLSNRPFVKLISIKNQPFPLVLLSRQGLTNRNLIVLNILLQDFRIIIIVWLTLSRQQASLAWKINKKFQIFYQVDSFARNIIKNMAKKDTKSKYEKLQDNLCLKKKSCWETWDNKIKKESFVFGDKYKKFLDRSKTEQEAVRESIKLAEEKGFKDVVILKRIKTGDKVYFNYKDRSLFLARIGKKKFNEGCKIIMAHVDSPHLDLKISPLYEDENLAFLKTHYYGGIKKYQWPTIMLALHGSIYLENGTKKEIIIGEKEGDTKFMITDLLPHLEGKKKREVKGEDLNLLVGSLPVDDKKIKEKVKLAILEILYKDYGIKEGDFSSAEFQIVPSAKASDIGFDKSLISGVGHDDKVCVFSSLDAFLNSENQQHSQVCILIDREEIGSEGASGAQSVVVERFFVKLLKLLGKKNAGINEVYEIFEKSKAISGDVTAGVDPDYKEVHDLKNSVRFGYGLALEKYTGHGGKYSSSEASAKFVNELKNIFGRDKSVGYQISGGLGKIDQGGGGTIAKYMANRGLDIIDAGVPVLNMHAPLEIISKADLYSAYLGYKVFYESE